MKKSEFVKIVLDTIEEEVVAGICFSMRSAWRRLDKRRFNKEKYRSLKAEFRELRRVAIERFGASYWDAYWWIKKDDVRRRLFLEWWIKDLKSRGE